MLREIAPSTKLTPPNLSDLGPRDTGCMPTHRNEASTVLCLFFRLIFPVGLEMYPL